MGVPSGRVRSRQRPTGAWKNSNHEAPSTTYWSRFGRHSTSTGWGYGTVSSWKGSHRCESWTFATDTGPSPSVWWTQLSYVPVLPLFPVDGSTVRGGDGRERRSFFFLRGPPGSWSEWVVPRPDLPRVPGEVRVLGSRRVSHGRLLRPLPVSRDPHRGLPPLSTTPSRLLRPPSTG